MTPEQRKRRRDRQREYMRRIRGSVRTCEFSHVVEDVDRSSAAYDPRRDPQWRYRDLTAALLGDPPIGRSALDLRI
jgi:hypothetical protein